MIANEKGKVSAAWSRVSLGTFLAFVMGTTVLGVAASSPVTPLYQFVLTTSVLGLVPVVIAATLFRPLVLVLMRSGVPLLPLALAIAVIAAVITWLVVALLFTLSGNEWVLPGYMAAAVAGWCGGFGTLAGRALSASVILYHCVLIAMSGVVVAGVIITVVDLSNGPI